MKKGDMVEWTSQAGGYTKTKRGKIVAVVARGQYPINCIPNDTYPFTQTFRDSIPRYHKSYLVQVGKRSKLYWPLVKNLKKITNNA